MAHTTKLTDKEKLAVGAAEIRKAEAEAKADPIGPFTDRELKPTRKIEDVLRDVKILPDHIGLKLKDDMPIAENLQVLDYVVQMGDHVQFMIGDVLNIGAFRFGEKKYAEALNRTGRARSTLFAYAQTARVIPPGKRIASLGFWHYQPLAKLEKDQLKLQMALKELDSAKNNEWSVKDVRALVNKIAPKKPKKPTSEKGKKKIKDKPEAPPYEPTETEERLLSDADAAVVACNGALAAARDVIFKKDNDYKETLADCILPIVKFYNALVTKTGYKSK